MIMKVVLHLICNRGRIETLSTVNDNVAIGIS